MNIPREESLTLNYVELLLSREFPGVEITPAMVLQTQADIRRTRDAEYCRERRRRDPIFKVAGNLRNQIYAAMKNRFKCSEHLPELIGCSLDYLRFWLQSNFRPGMSWENYGTWHIDHIKPVSRFDLSLPEQRKQCFHYSNLQPLWAYDNQSKHAKFIDTPNLG